MKALIVLSGGQDSTTVLYMAKQKQYEEIHAIAFDYGQRHRREVAAAAHIATMAGCKSFEVANIKDVLVSTSPLVDPNAKLEQYVSNTEMERIIGNRIELTFVPMRNALFLTIAANRAVALDAKHIYTGVCQADNANYPDCRAEFIACQQRTIDQAIGGVYFTICAPLLNMPKHKAILEAFKLDGCFVALAHSHTAYDGSYPPSGKDHATVLRAHSFMIAGVPDPLILRAWFNHELQYLPDSDNYARHHIALLGARRIAATADTEYALKSLENYFKAYVHAQEQQAI